MAYLDNPAQGTMEYLVIIAIVIVISLVVVGMSGVLVSDSGGQISSTSTDLSSRSGSSSGGVAIVESATDSSGNGLIKLNNFTGEGFSLTKVSVVSSDGSLVDNNFDSVYLDSSGALAFSLTNLGNACSCAVGETRKSCTFIVEYSTLSGLTKSQRLTTNVSCVSAISTSGTYVNPADFVGPIVSITNPTSGSTSNTSDVDFEYTVTDNNAVKECSLLIDDVVEDTDASAPFDLFAYTFPSNGDYNYEIECEDYSSNTGSNSGTVTLNFDDVNPSVTLSSPADDNSTTVARVDFNFYVSDSNALSQCVLVVDGDDVNTITSVANNAYNLIGYSLSSYDVYEWDVRCTDYSSNSVTSGAPREITYTAPPLSFSPTWAQGPASGTGTGADGSYSVAVDSSGNVYVAGYSTSTTLGFGPGITLTNRGSYDFFVVKYNSSGVAQWAKGPAAGSGSDNDRARGVAVDSSGNVYIVGDTGYTTTLCFGGVSNDVNLTVRSGDDFFVAKYDSSGVAQWARNAAAGSGSGTDIAYAVDVDSSGNVYVSGMGSSLNFGDGITTARSGFFVVKYNSSGVAQLALRSGADTESFAVSVAVDASNNIYTVGYFRSTTIDFGNGITLTRGAGGLSYEFFVVKYNSSGVAQWAQHPASGSGTSGSYAHSIAVDTDGNVIVAGMSGSTTLGFGGVGNDINLTNRGLVDFFVVKYNSSGVAQWANGPAAGTGTTNDEVRGVEVGSDGNVYISGSAYNPVSIGFGNGVTVAATGSNQYVPYPFVTMYNSSGVAQGAMTATEGGQNGMSAEVVTADSSGNVYGAGYFGANANFGGGITLTHRGQGDFYIVKGSFS